MKWSSPRTTYLVLPGPPEPPDPPGALRVVSRRAAVPLTLADYRHAPGGWADVGRVVYGRLRRLDAPLTVQHAMLAAEPIRAPFTVCISDEVAP